MYCINCGVRLADTEKHCPLCGTAVYHPELKQPQGEPQYPLYRYPGLPENPKAALFLITGLFLLPILITLPCDFLLNGRLTWFGYVAGGLGVSYVSFVLPWWFQKPNPTIFVPCSFLAAGLYLLYINLASGGHWFLSFAFPLVTYLGLLSTAVAALTRYLPRGRLFIYGGAILALGLFLPLMELFLVITFEGIAFTGWSFFSLIPLVLLGGFLIFLGICRPARQMMERKFFI